MESSHGFSIPMETKSNFGNRCRGTNKTRQSDRYRPQSTRVRFVMSLVLVVVSLTTAIGRQAAPPRRVAIRAAHLVDPASGQRMDDVVVLVEGDRITQVGSRLGIPA